MDLNVWLGVFLIIVALVSVVLAFLIAIREYLFPRVQKEKVAQLPTSVLELFLQLLDDILKAPPALAFLVSGILIGASGIWILVVKPI